MLLAATSPSYLAHCRPPGKYLLLSINTFIKHKFTLTLKWPFT